MENERCKVMVLAAGAGTRLLPLTYQVPKPMIPVANRPVLEYSFLNLKRQGFSQFMCNLHTHADRIRKYFGDGRKLGIKMPEQKKQPKAPAKPATDMSDEDLISGF